MKWRLSIHALTSSLDKCKKIHGLKKFLKENDAVSRYRSGWFGV